MLMSQTMDIVALVVAGLSGWWLTGYVISRTCKHERLEMVEFWSDEMDQKAYKHVCKDCDKTISYHKPAHKYKKNTK